MIKVPSGLVSDLASLPALKMVTISLCLHYAQRKLSGVSSFPYKDTSSIGLGLTLITSFNHNLLERPISKHSHIGS